MVLPMMVAAAFALFIVGVYLYESPAARVAVCGHIERNRYHYPTSWFDVCTSGEDVVRQICFDDRLTACRRAFYAKSVSFQQDWGEFRYMPCYTEENTNFTQCVNLTLGQKVENETRFLDVMSWRHCDRAVLHGPELKECVEREKEAFKQNATNILNKELAFWMSPITYGVEKLRVMYSWYNRFAWTYWFLSTGCWVYAFFLIRRYLMDWRRVRNLDTLEANAIYTAQTNAAAAVGNLVHARDVIRKSMPTVVSICFWIMVPLAGFTWPLVSFLAVAGYANYNTATYFYQNIVERRWVAGPPVPATLPADYLANAPPAVLNLHGPRPGARRVLVKRKLDDGSIYCTYEWPTRREDDPEFDYADASSSDGGLSDSSLESKKLATLKFPQVIADPATFEIGKCFTMKFFVEKIDGELCATLHVPEGYGNRGKNKGRHVGKQHRQRKATVNYAFDEADFVRDQDMDDYGEQDADDYAEYVISRGRKFYLYNDKDGARWFLPADKIKQDDDGDMGDFDEDHRYESLEKRLNALEALVGGTSHKRPVVEHLKVRTVLPTPVVATPVPVVVPPSPVVPIATPKTKLLEAVRTEMSKHPRRKDVSYPALRVADMMRESLGSKIAEVVTDPKLLVSEISRAIAVFFAAADMGMLKEQIPVWSDDEPVPVVVPVEVKPAEKKVEAPRVTVKKVLVSTGSCSPLVSVESYHDEEEEEEEVTQKHLECKRFRFSYLSNMPEEELYRSLAATLRQHYGETEQHWRRVIDTNGADFAMEHVDGDFLGECEALHDEHPPIKTFPIGFCFNANKEVLCACMRVCGGILTTRHQIADTVYIGSSKQTLTLVGSCRKLSVAHDLVWLDLVVPDMKNVVLKNFSTYDKDFPRIGICDSVNGQVSTAAVLSDATVNGVPRLHYKLSTDDGSCGHPIVDERGLIIGIHHANEEAIAITQDVLLFFRDPAVRNRAPRVESASRPIRYDVRRAGNPVAKTHTIPNSNRNASTRPVPANKQVPGRR